jgi:hypothetical protein
VDSPADDFCERFALALLGNRAELLLVGNSAELLLVGSSAELLLVGNRAKRSAERFLERPVAAF